MACHFALWGVVRATHGLPAYGPQCTVGVLAGTHWGDDSSRVMSHQNPNPLWLCRVGGHGRDRGRELSCGGRRAYTHCSSTPPRLVRSGCRAYESFLVELVFACFSGFVACLAIVPVLCCLTHHVLELHRHNEICVPFQVFMST